MKSSIKVPRNLFVFVTLLFIGVAWQYHNYTDNQRQTNRFQERLTERYEEFINWKFEVLQIVSDQNPNELFHDENFLKEIKINSFGLFIYKEGNPIFWSDAITKPKQNSDIKGLVELNNGWFIRDFKWVGDYKIIWLLELSQAFSISNQYLEPKFLLNANLPPGVKIIESFKENCYPIQLSSEPIFYLDFTKANSGRTVISALYTIVFYLWFITLLVLFYNQWLTITNYKRKWI